MQDAGFGRERVRGTKHPRATGVMGIVSTEMSNVLSTSSARDYFPISDQDKSGSRDEQTTTARPRSTAVYQRRMSALPMSDEDERIIVEHLPIVRYLARRIHERLPQQVEIEDLVSSGVLGLIDAFQKFDPEKKVQFRSYAQFRIRGAILDSLRNLDWSPRDLRRKGRAVEEAIRALTSRFGHAPSELEVATELGMELAEYQLLLGALKGLEIGT